MGVVLTESFIRILSEAGIYNCFVKGQHFSVLQDMILAELNKKKK